MNEPDEATNAILSKELSLFQQTLEDYNYKLYVFLELDLDDENLKNQQQQSKLSYVNQLDESNFKDRLLENQELKEHIQYVYVLYGDKSGLIILKSTALSNDIDSIVKRLIDSLNCVNIKQKQLPFSNKQTTPLYLISEINDSQLKLINENKSDSLKFIEAKTGLKLKKIKKSIYLCGLLFQFNLLNQLINDASCNQQQQQPLSPINTSLKSSSSSSFVSASSLITSCLIENGSTLPDSNSGSCTKATTDQIVNNHKSSSDILQSNDTTTAAEAVSSMIQPEVVKKAPTTLVDWRKLYDESKCSFNFKIKPKNIDQEESQPVDFFYDVYIFAADLTELNTDALVNANHPNLHPGYEGDGISVRIRERGGKQMNDTCKKIIRNERNNQLLNDSEVVMTKATGKLKSKYVLHAVAPTWTDYILNTMDEIDLEENGKLSPNANHPKFEKFEPLLEQTFTNILKIAHDEKLDIKSIAYPCASTVAGGAFDVPVELLAHVLYTQFVDFPIKINKSSSVSLQTICITSIEDKCVEQLGEIFNNYTEEYSTSSWAIPISPLSKLLSNSLVDYVPDENKRRIAKEKLLAEAFNSKLTISESNKKEEAEQQISTSVSSSTSSHTNQHSFESVSSENLFINKHPIILQRKRNDSSLTESWETPVDAEKEIKSDELSNLAQTNTNYNHSYQMKSHYNNSSNNHHQNQYRHNNGNDDQVSRPNQNFNNQMKGNSNNHHHQHHSNQHYHHNNQYNHQSNYMPNQNNYNNNNNNNNSNNYYNNQNYQYNKQQYHNNSNNNNTNSSNNGNNPPMNINLAELRKNMALNNNNNHHQQQHHNHYNNHHQSSDQSDDHHKSRNYRQDSSESTSNVQIKKSLPACCLFCQNENKDDLLTCGNSQCTGAFCRKCILNYLDRQSSQKCPRCTLVIDKNLGLTKKNNRVNDDFSRSSSSSSTSTNKPSSSRQHNTKNRYENNNHTNSSEQQVKKNSSVELLPYPNAIKDGKISVRVIDTPCKGYEKYKTVQITFQFEDGIQKENHPKPNAPYKGLNKIAYIPQIPEHHDILQFYRNALNLGMLFRIDKSKKSDDYQVQLGPEIFLKTSLDISGIFGYPDKSYINDLLKKVDLLKDKQ